MPGKFLVDARIVAMKKDKREGMKPSGFLSNVIASGTQSREEMLTTVSELMAAAVDTVGIELLYIIKGLYI